MSYGEVYANRGGSLLMDLGVTGDVGPLGGHTRAMLLIHAADGDFIYGGGGVDSDAYLWTIRYIDSRAFDPAHELWFGPPR